MTIYEFNKVIYKGNINRDFYIYCLKKNIKLVKYIFINIYNIILSIIFKKKSDVYIKKKFKYQKDIKNLEEERNTYFTKLPSSIEEYRSNIDTLSHTMDVDDLVKAFESFLERSREDKPINTKVTKKELSVDDRINDIRERIKYNHAIPFFDLFEIKTKEYIVVTFLAILELAKKQELIINQENNFGEIICEGINEV